MRKSSKVMGLGGLFLSLILILFGQILANPEQNVQVVRNLTSMPLAFTENQGQWDVNVLFRANAGGATMWFTKDGAVYQFRRSILQSDAGLDDPMVRMNHFRDHEPDSIESLAIKASFVGANPNPQMVGSDMMEYKCNYFIGNDPNEWHTDVPNYKAIIYEEIYSGIDLKYYGNGKQMEYDFIVSPGADPSQIAIQYEGAVSLSVNPNGELVVETEWGEVIEQRPVIYQLQDGVRNSIEGEYILKGANSFGFLLGRDYNPALPLVIDPVLSYSTYLGGSDSEASLDIALDGSGNAYITGWTYSTDFPTEGAFQATYQGGSVDAFVTKLNSSGNALVYSTYLGGSNDDIAYGIAVDGSGNAYVTGETYSTNFPTEGEYQTDQAIIDAFVTKLNSAGNGLVYSTYLGGDMHDYGYDIAVDGSGNAYIAGWTLSTDFPTMNPYQAERNGMVYDAFATKLNSSGNALVYSTYLGGTGDDRGRCITVDGLGNAYISGYTYSTDFPIEGPYQDTLQGEGGKTDVFVTKLSSSGSDLVYSTYLGGSLTEYSRGIAVDGSGNAYITGYTGSNDFPTANPYQANLSGTYQYDVFVTKLNSSGNDLVYSTYLGGSDYDYGRGIAVNGSGNAYITGNTNSTDFPTEVAYQATFQGAGNNYVGDAFVTKLNSSGNGLVYSTYLGGSHDDAGFGIAVDGSGNVFITGNTSSTDFPTEGEYQGYQGFFNLDAFVTRISEANDIDMDWIADDDDNCPTVYNPDQDNSDNDSHGDVCDNCLNDDNETQQNSDSDSYGDACDNCIVDDNENQQNSDNDSYGDTCDNCPTVTNQNQANSDTDSHGDVCDNCTDDDNEDQADGDLDSVGDVCDNCPTVYNPGQEDSDMDGVGDACEWICGDANGDAAVNILDITYLIAYLYKGGPAPDVMEAADVNNSASVNILDITYLIAYLYKGGPAPNCP